jgi:hypothetical protein
MDGPHRSPRLTRRGFARLGLGAALLAVAAPRRLFAEDADAKLVTEIPANATLVKTLQYVNVSTVPERNCLNCQLYTARSDDRGKCAVFAQGVVAAEGWCASWSPKVGG